LRRIPVERTAIKSRLEMLYARTPKRSGIVLPNGLLDAWKELRKLAEEAFYQAGCGGTECRQMEAEKGSLSETCDKGIRVYAQPAMQNTLPARPLLPALLVEACPIISHYPHPVRNIVDIVTAGRFLRACLGAHPSA